MATGRMEEAQSESQGCPKFVILSNAWVVVSSRELLIAKL